MDALDAPVAVDQLQHEKPVGPTSFEDRGVAAAMAPGLGALRRGTRLGRTLAAYDRPQPGQAAKRGKGNRANRRYDPGTRRPLSARSRRLARDHRWPRQADLGRR